MFKMTYKQIEASREARLWIGQIVIPVVTLAMTSLAIPEVRQTVATKANQLKTSIETKLKRKDEES
jgi:hypothetical protein